MRRSVLLGILIAAGAASMAAQTPAAGPKVIDILKLKDNLYVLTSSTPGNAATFSGGNVAVFITDTGVTWSTTSSPAGARRCSTRSRPSRQAGHAHHQHPHARRSHRQQRVLRRQRRDRRAGEHQGEHGEDGRLQGRRGQVPAVEDLHGQDDARQRQGSHRSLLLRRRPHQRRRLRRLSGAAGPAHRRRVRLEGRPALRPQQRRQLRRVAGTLQKALAASRTSTP